MSKLVTIYGGSGFVGRYIARRMAKAGWRVRVAVRRPNEALFVRTYGVVGQVEPVLCNIRDDASVASVMQGADAVVNCVGVLAETGKNTFDELGARVFAEVVTGAVTHTLAYSYFDIERLDPTQDTDSGADWVVRSPAWPFNL